MKPKTISVHLIETNPNVPLRPALDYNALGSTQPNLHDVSTQFPHAILLKFKDPPCLEAPSAILLVPGMESQSSFLLVAK